MKQPEATRGDAAHAVVKAALSAVPVVGGPATELFSAIIEPPLTRRRNEWIERIAAAVRELQDKVEGLTPESLSQNESFVTTLLHATQVASRSHQEEKLEALRNAVMNAVLPGSPEEDQQRIFLTYIDDLTPWHLRVLAFFDNPLDWGEKHDITFPSWRSGGPADVLEHSFAELKGNRIFYDQLVRDLQARGLLSEGWLHTMMTATGMFASRTTDLGKSFLAFISEPR